MQPARERRGIYPYREAVDVARRGRSESVKQNCRVETLRAGSVLAVNTSSRGMYVVPRVAHHDSCPMQAGKRCRCKFCNMYMDVYMYYKMRRREEKNASKWIYSFT